MNDYLGASHEAIFDMVQEGEPGQSAAWARCVTGVSRDLGSLLESLREHSVRISSVWSDGVGSVRLTADLNAVIDYLQVLADGLSGQSASYADITLQAAADLAAAQPPSVMPPPPSRSPAELSIAPSQAAWITAGETATTLDNQYRTALARLTPPPEPPPIVLVAATAGEAAAAPPVTGAVAAVGGVWAPDRQPWSGSTGSGGSVDAGSAGPEFGSAAGGPARFDSGTGAGVSTTAVVGVGRVAASTGGVLRCRGGAEAVTAAGLIRGFGAAGIGAGGAGAGGQRSGSDSSRTDGAGTADPAANSGRGVLGGVPGAGSTSLVKGGQIGQVGLPLSGPAGVGIGRAGAPGAGIGGEHGCRVTWLVEDRDLYGRGPSVKPVIEAPDAK